MIKRLIPLLVMLITACGGGGGDSAPVQVIPPPTPAVPTASEVLATDLAGLTLADFYDTSFKALSLRSPEGVMWRDLTSIYPLNGVGLDDLSDGYQRETFAMYQVALDALHTYDRTSLGFDQQLTYDFYEWHLQDVVDRLQYIYHDFVATFNIISVQSQTQRFFTDIHPMETRQDAEDYVTRLNAVLQKFRQVANHLNLQNGAGIVEPRITLDAAIGRLANIANGSVDGNPYFLAFQAKLNDIAGLSDTQRQNLETSARNAITTSVIPAYQELRQALLGLQSVSPTTIGVAQYPNGTAYYNYQLRRHTTTDLTAAQIHQLGLNELDRLHTEMRVMFDQLGYPQNETLQQLYARVANDGGIIRAANVKSTYEAIIDEAEAQLDQAFDIFPSADVVVGEDAFGGFYIGPSFDGSRPGTFFAGTQNDRAWFQMPSLTYHESVPGHHTQIAIAMDQGTLPLRRTLRFTAFVEGWALYAERLAFELAWYDNDPYGNLGRLQFEALRAARLVMDTGIHAMGWSFEQAVQFNQDNVGASRGSSEGASGRYSVWPGQATAYMVGMLHILDARQRAMDQLGTRFDLKEFHRVVLSSGGIPLALLDGVVDRYIENELSVR